MKILYFAWVREKIGVGEEEVQLPDEVKTVGDLMAWLCQRSPAHAEALKDPKALRTAVDLNYVDWDTEIAEAQEIAFFPPMTGGSQ